MDFWTILLTIVGGALCIYFYLNGKFGYFEKLGIPCVKPNLIFGNTAGMIFKYKSMQAMYQDTYNCHPDAKYVGFYDFSSPVIMLKDPELVKSIAIKNFDSFPNHKPLGNTSSEPLFQKNLFALNDDEWRSMRSLLSPAFTSSKMKLMFETLSKCAIDFSDYLAKLNPQPEELDMKDTFVRYTLDVIASSAFGLSVNSMKDRDNDFYRLGRSVGDFSSFKIIKMIISMSFPWLGKLLNIRILDAKTSDFFTNMIETTIATRDAEGIVRPDMIDLMMQARDRKDKYNLSIDDMTAQALIFFIGGLDSPATAMCFAAHLLALNPDVQRKLQSEIDQELEKNSGEVTYEGLHAMKYLDAVVSETLRMFPPTEMLNRISGKSFTLPPALPGLEPLPIKPGQSILIPPYSFHHDAKHFPEPEKFDPERFNDENKSKINPLTYLPFGVGPRICIANRFALMEVKLALFHLLGKCNLLPTPKTQSPIKLSAKSFLAMPEGGFWLKLQPRK